MGRQPKGGPVALTQSQCKQLARSQGLDDYTADVMGYVAMCESSGNPNATHANSNGTTDTGLWQINSVHQKNHPSWTVSALKDPTVNAAAMAVLLREAKGDPSGPWSSSKSCWQGKADFHIEGVTGRVTGGAEALGDAAGSVLPDNPLDSIGDLVGVFGGFLEWVSDPNTWKRVALVAAGGAVAVAGVVVIARGTDTGQAVESTVTTVATKGAVTKPGGARNATPTPKPNPTSAGRTGSSPS